MKLNKYFAASTIHGMKYLSNKYHLVERIFWALSLIASIICTSMLIEQLISRIRKFPIINYLSDRPIPISEVNKHFFRVIKIAILNILRLTSQQSLFVQVSCLCLSMKSISGYHHMIT
jgi:Amiloride-sensitive sodium channel